MKRFGVCVAAAVLLMGCSSSGDEAPTAPTGGTSVEAVCQDIDLALSPNEADRLGALEEVYPRARHAGFGIGPTVYLLIQDLKAERHTQAANRIAALQNLCDNAT